MQVPSALKSMVNGERIYSEFTGPFRKRFCLSAMREKPVCAAVVVLLALCCPSAVTRFVVPVVVDTVEAVPLAGTRPHVVNKRLKRSTPAVAHGDPPCAVVAIVEIPRILAPALHVSPARVLSGPNAVGGASVLCNSTFLATRFVVSPPKIGTIDDDNIAAVTSASPVCSVPAIGYILKNRQLAISFSGFVFDALRKLCRIGRSHDVTLSERVALWIEPRQGYSLTRLASLYRIGSQFQRCP